MSKITLDLNHLFSLQGKVALVTGGSRGIGRMITQGLLQAGAKVYISARNEESCRQAATELSEYGQCIALPADVANPQSRSLLCQSLLQIEPELHIPTVNRTGNYAYSASKAALHHLTKELAVELGPRQITVNAVAPGYFPSKISEHTFKNFRQDIEDNSLLKRVGKDQEMAGIAVYLCSRAGAYTHGAIIPVDGGTSINHQHVSG